MASKERLSVASEPYCDIPCVVCSKSGRHVEATNTCLDCKQALCSGCLKDHDKFDITKGHRVLDKATTVVGQIPSQMCDDHTGKLVDMYCSQHDSVHCTSCIAIHHRQCDGIDYVPAISAGTKTSQELKTALLDMKGVLAELKETQKEREGDKERLAAETWRSEQNVHESVERIIACINDLKDKSLHQIQQQHDTFQKNIDNDIEKIRDTILSLEDDIKDLQSPSYDNDSQLFVTLKLSKNNKERSANLNSYMGASLFREAMHFNVDHQIEANMKTIKSLGELETPFFTSQSLGRYTMRGKDDKKKCYITGICAMPDGTTLVTDFNNENLKRLDLSYKVIDRCKVAGWPTSICSTGPTEVAITLVNAQTIQFVSVDKQLTPTRTFHVGKKCQGIAYSKGQLFITCGDSSDKDEYPGELRVYSTDGKLLYNLPQKSTDPQFLTCPLQVAVSRDGSKVTVQNGSGSLVTMNRDGSNVNQNSLPARNLCIQDHSLWFTCSGVFKSIYQLNDDGSNLGVLITEQNGLDEKPQAICYQKDGNRLIVGFQDCDYIEVFQLNRK